ncbi:MAG: hypothetical protein K2K76_08970 [Muribaculaceae bacterium]|nr:hypothetical protein [Muribaculaceae bacterium]
MTLDEIKNSMNTLDRGLADTPPTRFSLDTARCNTARARLIRNYRRATLSCLILGIVFTANWVGGVETQSFPASFRGFLGIYLLLGAVWYAIITSRIRSIDIATSTPGQTIKAVASFRRLVLCGEIAFGVALVVFFTLFLSHLITVDQYVVWIILGFLALSLILAITVFLPKTLRDFRNLTALTAD